MTFLPIVERELRVAARHQFTYWSRPTAAGFTLFIFGFMVFFLTIATGIGGSPGPGPITFAILSWLAFIFAGSIGVFLTSDSLSEEKREGTLGLLFLTDLRGYDIVFGKLMSQSLLAFYALVAAFPVLALPLMLGGVTGAEFGCALLVICNTLLLSLAIGMFVSSVSREVTKALTLTLILSLVLLVGLPWFDAGWAEAHKTTFACITSVASPSYLFTEQKYLRPHEFWSQLAIQHALAWGFLALACVAVPRAWKEKSNNSSGWFRKVATWWSFGGKRARQSRRRKLLAVNPLRWLAARDRSLHRWIWVAVLLALYGVAQTVFGRWLGEPRNDNLTFYQYLLVVLLFLWITTQACRFFVEATRNGALELILVTPATPRQIVQGQWRTLWRMFLIPALFILALHLAGGIDSLLEMRKAYRSMNPPQTNDYEIVQLTSLVAGVLDISTELLALAWFGMWMGVKSRKTSIAVLKTICFVFVLPWLVQMMLRLGVMIGMARLMNSGGVFKGFQGRWLELAGTLAACVLILGKNLFFILWSRHKLLTALRETVALGGQPKTRRWKRPVPLATANPRPQALPQ